jgi:hypothetical protein
MGEDGAKIELVDAIEEVNNASSKKSVPPSTFSRRLMQRRSVDLPAPDGPLYGPEELVDVLKSQEGVDCRSPA